MNKDVKMKYCCVYGQNRGKEEETPHEFEFAYAEEFFVNDVHVETSCKEYELAGGRKDGIKDGWMPFELRSVLFTVDRHFSNTASFSPMSDDSILEGFLEITLPEYISLYEKKHGKMP